MAEERAKQLGVTIFFSSERTPRAKTKPSSPTPSGEISLKGLNKLSRNVVIKVPVNIEGIKAIKMLVPLGVKTNTTLIFSPTQGLVAGLANSP